MSRRIGSRASAAKTVPHPSAIAFFAALALLSVSACSSPTEEVESVLGGIEVTVLAEGETTLPESLVVLLNGDLSGPVDSTGVFTIPYLPPGPYLVSLRDEQENCSFRNNDRPVTVERRKVTTTTFLVRCS
jgi:hypothetical protein